MLKPAALLSALVLAPLLSACDRFSNAPTEVQVPNVNPYVSERLAGQLTADGHFRLAPAQAPDDIPIISADRARELARAYLRSWGRDQLARWAWERGGSLDPGAVAPSSRVYFAQTPHGRLPNDLYHPAIRRIYGPMYIVPLEHQEQVVALLAVSAYSTDLGVDSGGLIEMPKLGGSYFFSKAVAPAPRDPRFQFVAVSPEEAVKHVAERTGARVTEVPELVLLAGYHPASAAWRIRVDRPVRVRRTALPTSPGVTRANPNPTPFAVREVYVANNHIVTVPSPDQPTHKSVHYPTGPGTARGEQPGTAYDLPRRGELPILHETVEFDEEGR